MNSVNLIGRLTKDPELRYGSENQNAYCRINIAIDRGKDKNGNDLGADFPSIVCFGKTAENIDRYCKKGRLIAVEGRIRTGKYEKDGKAVYTTDVYAERVQFLEWDNKNNQTGASSPANDAVDIPAGFELTGDDIPF